MKNAEKALVGHTLTVVSFVHDYIQLIIGDCTINIMVPMDIRDGDKLICEKDCAFGNLLRSCIGKEVVNISIMQKDYSSIEMKEGLIIIIDTNDERRSAPEAVSLTSPTLGLSIVW